MNPIIRLKFTTIAKLVVWFEHKELTDNKTIRHGKNTLTFKNSRRFQENAEEEKQPTEQCKRNS